MVHGRCSVPECPNKTDCRNAPPGVSFHHFPLNDKSSSTWVEAIGLSNDPNWKLSRHKFVCSDHFQDGEICKATNNKRFLKKGSIPSLKLHFKHNENYVNTRKKHKEKIITPEAQPHVFMKKIEKVKEELEDVIEVIESPEESPQTAPPIPVSENQFPPLEDFNRICRICLEQSSPLTNLCDSEYFESYQFLTGLEVDLEDEFPKHVCNNCLHELSNASKFVYKARQSWQKLNEIEHEINTSNTFAKSKGESKTINIRAIQFGSNNKHITLDGSNRLIVVKHIKAPQEWKQSPKNDITEDYTTDMDLLVYPEDDNEMKIEVEPKVEPEVELKVEVKPKVEEVSANTSQCQSCGEVVKSFSVHYKKHKDCRSIMAKNCRIRKATNSGRSKVNYPMWFPNKQILKLQCWMCMKRFRYWKHLKEHISKHELPRRFSCLICNEHFSKWSLRNDHMNIHTGCTPHKCTKCQKTFATRASKYKHVLNNHRTGKKSIPARVDLSPKSKSPKLIHTQNKDHSCEVCGRTFRTQKSLTDHYAVHADEKLFKCLKCDKQFQFNTNLQLHLLTHSIKNQK